MVAEPNDAELEQPPQPMIYSTLSAVMGAISAVGKDTKNVQQGFNFRGIDAILNMVAPALRKHEVLAFPTVLQLIREVVKTQKGNEMAHVLVEVRWTFRAIDGSQDDTTVVWGEAMDVGDKALTKAQSVAQRTAYIQVFAIPTNDKDPDEDTYERGNGSQQHQEAPAELPATEKKLLDDATTVDELKAIGEIMRTNDNLLPAVTKALGYYWQKRMSEVLDKAANDVTEGSANARVGATQDTLDN